MRRLHFLETSVESERKAPDSTKTENEGIQRIPPKDNQRAGLILLFDGEAVGENPGLSQAQESAKPDERSKTGILTSSYCLKAFSTQVVPAGGMLLIHGPYPCLPGHRTTSGNVGFVTRYSGVTVPDLHGVP